MKSGEHSTLRSYVRVLISRVLMSLLGLLFGLLLAESLMRLAAESLPPALQIPLREVHQHPFTQATILPPPLWSFDPVYGTVGRPNNRRELQVLSPNVSIHILTTNWLDPNSQIGFRAPAPYWRPAQPLDIVVVGDSFSYCFTEYPDCWVQRLAGQHGLSLANLAQPGSGSSAHLALLRDFGLRQNPRRVIWQWFGNDFRDDYEQASRSGEVPPLAAPVIPEEPKLSDFEQWLKENSALYALIKTPARRALERDALPARMDRYHVQQNGLDLWFGQAALREEGDITTAPNQFGLKRTQDSILSARDLLAAAHIPFLIVLIPIKEEVYRSITEPYLGAEWLAAATSGRHAMLDFCRDEKLDCLDLTDALTAQAESGAQVYWPTDLHLNPAGNQVAADQIAAWLADHAR